MTTILIMEDDMAIHSLIKETVELNGLKTMSAYSGTEGKLLFEQNQVDLVLLDLMLPGMNGEEFQNGTIRNALSLGRSRTHYYFSKFITAALLALIGVIAMTAIGMISFTIVFGFGEMAEINDYFWYATKTFSTLYLLMLANVSIYVMISFITKNSSTSLVWSFIYTIGTGFGAGIFQQTTNFKYITYWFTESFLFYSDFAKPTDIARFPEMVLVSVITIVVSSIIGIHLFKRTDIK